MRAELELLSSAETTSWSSYETTRNSRGATTRQAPGSAARSSAGLSALWLALVFHSQHGHEVATVRVRQSGPSATRGSCSMAIPSCCASGCSSASTASRRWLRLRRQAAARRSRPDRLQPSDRRCGWMRRRLRSPRPRHCALRWGPITSPIPSRRRTPRSTPRWPLRSV